MLQGLDLALLVNAQHHGMVGWVEVEADDVADLLDKEGIGGEREVLLPVGLEVERGPDTLVDLETPVAAAMERQVQCVLPSGGLVSSVFRSSVMRVSSGRVRGLPGRCSS